MTLLSVIQDHCRINALNVPSGIIGSTDTTVSQLFQVLVEVLDEAVTEAKFEITTKEATFVSIATASQGAMTTLAPSGFQWMIPETLFDRTLKRPLYGPMSATEWQRIQALPNPGPFYKFRIRGGSLLFNPVPAAPFSTIAFEYVSSWCVKSMAGVLQSALLADTDTFVFPENLVKKGLSYRWKQIKGLPYQADEAKFYSLLNNFIIRDKAPGKINVSETSSPTIQPGVFIPSGNWFQ